MDVMLKRTQTGGVVVYRSSVLDSYGVAHAFGTRHGDEHAMAEALNLRGHAWVRVRQVHGKAVYIEQEMSGQDTDAPRCDADAILLQAPGGVARILTADCVPVLLARADRGAVAAVHAGWRGLVSGVIEQAVAELGGGFVAAVGPCIGVEQFEVGEEVAGQFDPRFVRRDLGPKPHIDLRAAAGAALLALGAEAIDIGESCTYADEGDFFSHRRDVTHGGASATGRMVNLVAI